MIRHLLPALTISCALAGGAAARPDPASAAASPSAQPKVLRYAIPAAETNFDPPQITDLYSRQVAAGIYDAPLAFAFLKQPAGVRPNTLVALPEVSADQKVWTLRVKPGIYFADDPAFQGRRRELTAADYAYSVKRHYDPVYKSGNLYLFENAKLLGASELRKELIAARQPFDYDRPVEGLQVLDRYTLQLKFAEPQPRFHYTLADPGVMGAVAREVVEHYKDKLVEHPVGTGPFMLGEWKRSSRIVLLRNPGYRDERYAEEPDPKDPALVARTRPLQGRRLPLVDRVEFSVIEEPQPRWLSFLSEEQDVCERVPDEFAERALPNNKLAPDLAKRGIFMLRYARTDVSVSYFNMEHPLVGGYTPEKVALRRAIALAVDLPREIRNIRRGQAIPAQSHIAPGEWGYDPHYKSEMSDFDRARAVALLDEYGYVDRDGDGWRDQPDGQPLELVYASSPDQTFVQLAEQWKRDMDAIRVRIRFDIKQWPEQLKASRAGKHMMWGVSWSATTPDADSHMVLGYGPAKGQANHARFDLPAYNRLFETERVMPDGPERLALIRQAQKLMVAYMPYKVHVHRIWTDLAQPWVKGYHRNVFVREFYKYVDVDMNERARLSRR
jgi:ABC-type transport system substrate-binding protein